MAGGGIYRFRCGDVGCEQPGFEKFVWDADLASTHCPLCGLTAVRRTGDERAFGADFATPYASRAWGVSPDKINEAKANFPHHEFAKDGSLLIRNVREYDRVRQDLGMG